MSLTCVCFLLLRFVDVPLLKMAEEDFEALEADQLTVQGMLASRFVKQFVEEVTAVRSRAAFTTCSL
jgi:hypothetical protein